MGHMLDDEGRENYRVRYRELQESLAEAQENHDMGRLDGLRAEMDALATELARVTGLGGRSRQQTDADRIRKSVSMAVGRDIERIGSHHPKLGRHLMQSVSAGQVFRYSPEGEMAWVT